MTDKSLLRPVAASIMLFAMADYALDILLIRERDLLERPHHAKKKMAKFAEHEIKELDAFFASDYCKYLCSILGIENTNIPEFVKANPRAIAIKVSTYNPLGYDRKLTTFLERNY